MHYISSYEGNCKSIDFICTTDKDWKNTVILMGKEKLKNKTLKSVTLLELQLVGHCDLIRKQNPQLNQTQNHLLTGAEFFIRENNIYHIFTNLI